MSDSTSLAINPSVNLNWPPTNTLIPAAQCSIYLWFHGLMCLAYNNEGEGRLEAGIHSKADEHHFRIEVYAFDGNLILPRLVYSFAPDSYEVPGGIVDVNISRPCDPGVYFYLPPEEDDYSWSQILDLEGPEFYKRKLKKHNILKPRIQVNHGLFCVSPTTKTFIRYEDNNGSDTDIGPIAFIGIGLVRHEGTGFIEIATQREKLSLSASTDHPLLVIFSNSCPKNDCEADDNDFPFYYKAIKLKRGEKKYRLKPGHEVKHQARVGDLSFLERLFDLKLFDHILSNQDAPCGIAGYGQSNGIYDSTGT